MRIRTDFLVGSMLMLVGQASAQLPTAAEPTTQPIELRTIPVDPVLVDLHAQTPDTSRHRAVVERSPRWRIAGIFGPGVSDSATSARLVRSRAECLGAPRLAPDVAASILGTNPWAAFDSAAAGKPLVSFVVSPVRKATDACDERLQNDPDGVLRGLLLPSGVVLGTPNSPMGLTVTVANRAVTPAFLGRALALPASRSYGLSQVRAYIPLDDLAPQANGRLSEVRLVIQTANRAVTDTVLLPDAMLRAIWHQALPYRLQRVSASTRGAWDIALPAENPGLARAADAHNRGDVKSAAVLSAGDLGSTNAEQRRFARVALAQVLAADGDSSASTLLLAEQLREEPCLSISDRVDANFRAALRPVRPPARCTAMSSAAVFASGLLAPGNGQRATGRKAALTYASLTTLFAGVGALVWQGAKSDHAAYQAATSPEAAVNAFRNANYKRGMARNAAIAAATVWVVGAIEATIAERSHRRRLRHVGEYGAQP